LADPAALVFDLDGTLIDSAPDIHLAANKIFQNRGLEPFPFNTVKGFIGNGVDVLIARLLAERGQPDTGSLHAEMVREFVNIYE
jgi:phosphoglycolate phosphatase